MKNRKQVGIWFELDDYEVIRKLAFDNKKSVAAYLRSVVGKEIKKQISKERKNENNN